MHISRNREIYFCCKNWLQMGKPDEDVQFEITKVSDLNENLPKNAWMVRPCEWYKEEYNDCTSIRARFHQYFIFGESIDCTQWKKDYGNCMKFRCQKEIEYLEQVLESEVNRKNQRLGASKANDIWQLRDKPPENWNSPLPDWLIKQQQNSFFHMKQNEFVEDGHSSVFTGLKCTIL